ncbi:MAG: thiamine pyrophosphate-binding protein, partial [Proteobacteria bacterium]|nr:thiamine pyrophosphate-binding protein [Pseudomonadota bacterium]
MAVDRPNEPERPVGTENAVMGWGSDVVAELVRRLDIPYIAMVPGASYRGFQDSLVNYLGNREPQMLVCLHEEHCVAIAHGYAKVTDTPMAAAVHSNVGLMHATMAVFDAWCDRAPVMVFGATGPVDANLRRPWIDWIHTSRDQGALVRDYVKWDDQPASPEAAIESVLRANRIMRRHPQGPVYIVLDVAMQESKLDPVPEIPDVARYAVEPDPAPTAESVAAALELLQAAKAPLIMAGRVSRSQEAWDRRIAFAEALGAKVITNQRIAAAFPTHHPLHPNHLNYRTTAADEALIRDADVILNLDWLDFGGTLQTAAQTGEAVTAKIISVSMDDLNSNGWSFDHHVLPPVDLPILATPDSFVAAALPLMEAGEKRAYSVAPSAPPTGSGPIDLVSLGTAVDAAIGARAATYVRLPIGWPAPTIRIDGPLDYIGNDGGAGVGSGPGMVVGSALALQGTGRLPVAIMGDGDFLMGASALWTTAHYGIPLLLIVNNNRSYGNDVAHQSRMATQRGRPVENRWIGQSLENPRVDIPAQAR